MPRCMNHNNGYLMAAIDCETTGLDPQKHSMWNLAIVPLDANFQPLKEEGILPFDVMIQPESIDHIDWSIPIFKNNRTRIAQAINEGLSPDDAVVAFEAWYKRLRIDHRKRLMPLGQNYAFDKAFIQEWLGGPLNYGSFFHHHYRDTMIAAHYINDRLAFRAEPVAFPKQNLEYLCSTLGVTNHAPHTAIGDAMAAAKVMEQMMHTYLR